MSDGIYVSAPNGNVKVNQDRLLEFLRKKDLLQDELIQEEQLSQKSLQEIYETLAKDVADACRRTETPFNLETVTRIMRQKSKSAGNYSPEFRAFFLMLHLNPAFARESAHIIKTGVNDGTLLKKYFRGSVVLRPADTLADIIDPFHRKIDSVNHKLQELRARFSNKNSKPKPARRTSAAKKQVPHKTSPGRAVQPEKSPNFITRALRALKALKK